MRTNTERALGALQQVAGYSERVPDVWPIPPMIRWDGRTLTDEERSFLLQDMGDLIADLQHLCKLVGVEWTDAVVKGNRHHDAETACPHEDDPETCRACGALVASGEGLT